MKIHVAPLLFSLSLSGTLLAQVQTSSHPAPSLHTPGDTPSQVDSTLPARLSVVEGTVRIAQAPAGSAQTGAGELPPPPPADQHPRAALMNAPVPAGTEVETGGDGRAEIQFSDGSLARLTPNSALELVKLPSGGEELRALRGLAYFEIPNSGTGLMTVDAGPDTARLEPNSLLRFDLDNSPYRIGVLRGAAHFSSPKSDIGFEVNNGETAVIDPASPSSYDLTEDVADNSWDAWNTDRDQALAELAEGETNARVGNGDEDAAAWNDLDYYGTWYDVPGAGMAWAPDGVDASFDPYGAGAWTYYTNAGYTWVSSYPWGWLPYHCGGWSYFSGFGWGWQPGGACGGGVGWYPYTGIHQAPPNYRLPAQPLDPRLRTRLTGTPLPRSRPLPVQRGPRYSFRAIGGARPDPRTFPLHNTASNEGGGSFAPTLPVGVGRGIGRPAYGGPVGNGFANGSGFVGGVQPPRVLQPVPQSGPIYTRGANAITPPPRVLAAPRSVIAPPPHVVAPPAVRYAPPPPAAVPHATVGGAPPHGH